MKIKGFLLTLFLIGLGTSLNAEVPSDKSSDNNMYQELRQKRLSLPEVDTYLLYMRDQLSKMKTISDEELERAKTEEFWLERISKIPPEHMQYYAPSLFTNKIVPKSILELPEIKKYKGKLPERIAPEVKDIVKKYGKDISPDWYHLMIPETYEQFREKKKNEDQAEPIKIVRQIEIKKDDAEKVFRSSGMSPFMKEAMALIDANMDFIDGKISKERNKKIDDSTKLTNQDVLDFIATIPDIRMAVENGNAIKPMLMTKGINLKNGTICEVFIERTKRAGLFGNVVAEMKKNNFEETDWLNICNRVFNASRYTRLDFDKADMIYKQSLVAPLVNREAPDYDAKIDDYIAFYPYRGLFYRAFTKDMFIVGGY